MVDLDRPVRLVVFDWAGTTVDFGCFGPVESFIHALGRHGVEVTPEEVRGPMGSSKKDHLRELLRLPGASNQWREVQGRDWDESDVERIYRDDFAPLQIEAVTDHTRLVPGLLDVVRDLRSRGLAIATTTGYFREAAAIVFEAAARQGYRPDCDVVPEDVPAGRPEPWMIRRAMDLMRVDSPDEVVKVGDTPADIAEGRNAGVWTVGVIASSSEVGCTEESWAAMPEVEKRSKVETVRVRFLGLGAHAVIETLAELPGVIRAIEVRLRRGEGPENWV